MAFLLARGSGETERERDEARVRARWASPAERDAVAADVDAYLGRHGQDPEARAFALEAHLRIGRPERALSAALGGGDAAGDPAALRRFADAFLRRLAESGPAAARARLVLAEAGDPAEAAAVRDAIAAASGVEPVMPWFRTAALAGGASRRLVGEALRAHGDGDLRLAGATLLTGPRDAKDVPLLLERVGATFRRERFPTWRHVVRALGTSGDARAREALRAERAALPADGGDAGDAARDTLDVGLALLGEPAAVESVLRHADDGGGMLYAYGLGVLREEGDGESVDRLRALWDARPGLHARLAVAFACLLGEAPPPPEIPADAWLSTLAQTGNPLAAVLGPVHRWRMREPGSHAALVDALRRLLADPEATDPGADGLGGPSAALLEVLRALARWPGPA